MISTEEKHAESEDQRMRVNLKEENLERNPFRNFDVDPIDPENVNALKASIKEDHFWGGIVARRVKGRKQIIAGEHRRRAALAAGIEEADIFVGDFDDDAVVRIYARENATQRGNTSTALAGSVAAAIRILAQHDFTANDSAVEINNTPHARDDQGIGWPRVFEKLKGIPGVSENVCRQLVANLKASGDYDKIVREEAAAAEERNRAAFAAAQKAETERIEAERREAEARTRREEAERERKAAEEERRRKQAEAKAAHEAKERQEAQRKAAEAEKRRDAAEKQRKAAEAEEARRRSERQVAQAKEKTHAAAQKARARIETVKAGPKQDITFDLAGVSRVFKDAAHVETFKKWATGGDVRRYLPVDGQAALAQDLKARATKLDRELTSAFIKEWAAALLMGAKYADKKEEDERARQQELLRHSWEDKARMLQSDFARNARGLLTAAERLTDLQKQRPSGVTFLASGEFRTAVDNIREALTLIEKRMKL